MKDFIITFLICFIGSLILLGFLESLIFTNIYVTIGLISLVLALNVNIYISHETRIKELENKIELITNKIQN